MDPEENTPQAAPENAPAPAASPEPAAPPPAAAPPKPASSVVTLPASAMASLKAEQRERGARELVEKLDREAQALGYQNHADMLAVIKRAHDEAQRSTPSTTPAASKPTPAPAAAKPSPTSTDAEVRMRLLAEEKRRANRRAAAEVAERKKIQRRLQQQEATFALTTAAVRAGVEDVDYALHLARNHIRSAGPEGLAAFNEVEFFSGLRKTHPHLFGVQTQPATTAPSSAAPAAPTQQRPVSAPGGKGVMEMSRDEYVAHLRSLGLKDPSLGL